MSGTHAENRERLGTRHDKDLLVEFMAKAEREGLNKNEAVDRALREWLDGGVTPVQDAGLRDVLLVIMQLAARQEAMMHELKTLEGHVADARAAIGALGAIEVPLLPQPQQVQPVEKEPQQTVAEPVVAAEASHEARIQVSDLALIADEPNARYCFSVCRPVGVAKTWKKIAELSRLSS